MDQNQQYPMNNAPVSPNPQPTPPYQDQPSNIGESHKRVGPMVVTLVIVLIVVIAALYLLASSSTPESLEVSNEAPAAGVQEQDMAVPAVTSTSDDPSDLQADLETSVSGLDDQNF